tara:strand:- start:850 stop:1611 length:762 start_codon:yes stop_codon:yes gene_type:complete
MKSGRWIPNSIFNGIAPIPKKTIKKRDKFRVHIAAPPQKTYSHEEMVTQRQLWTQHQVYKQEALRKQNEEYAAAQQKKAEQDAAQRKQAEYEKMVAAADALKKLRMKEEEELRRFNLPMNQLKRLRDQYVSRGGNPKCYFYYMDGSYNFYESEANATSSSETLPFTSEQVPDELRDIVWPKLHKLTEELKVIRHVLQCLREKKKTTRYLQQIELRIQRREEDELRVLKQISILGEKQQTLLNWTSCPCSTGSS